MQFATFLIMRFDPGQPPTLLDHWLELAKTRTVALGEYVSNTYAFDPFYQYTDIPAAGGVYRLSDIAPDRFFFSEYYLQYYRHAGLCDEVGFLAPVAGGSVAHLSISRLNEQGVFPRRAIRFLHHYSPVFLELLARHCSSVSPPAERGWETIRPPLYQLLRAHGLESLGISLTHREAQVAALIMQGHSNRSAAMALEIAAETCKVHRRNLYRKLEISSQGELFGLFKHLL